MFPIFSTPFSFNSIHEARSPKSSPIQNSRPRTQSKLELHSPVLMMPCNTPHLNIRLAHQASVPTPSPAQKREAFHNSEPRARTQPLLPSVPSQFKLHFGAKSSLTYASSAPHKHTSNSLIPPISVGILAGAF